MRVVDNTSVRPIRHRTSSAARRRPPRRLLALVTMALLAWAEPIGGSTARADIGLPGAPTTLRLGSQSLTKCSSSPVGYCGRLLVPLDRHSSDGPKIALRYRFYPADGGARSSTRTVVPIEGGPGYSTIASVADGYLPMYGSLLRRWNLLAVDNRGTGGSTPLDCKALQGFSGSTSTNAFNRAVQVCATALNHRWRYPDGRWVHASSQFGSSAAAADVGALIRSLGLAGVDVYGDSYGSYFAQVFASRFPGLVRSVTLDSTYQVKEVDPLYRSTVAAMPAAFNAVCRRSITCASAAPGTSWSRLVRLARALDGRAISGNVPSFTGDTARVRMDTVGLINLLSAAARDAGIYRETDAAARAYLDHRDSLPLLRLYDQSLGYDEAQSGQPASEYSVELYLAVSCTDYRQLFDMSASTDVRTVQLRQAERAALDSFSPFTVSDWLAQDQNTETYTACLNWPASDSTYAPVAQTPPLPSTIPVLVLEGQLDTWTPPSGARHALSQIGGHHRYIELANATHVVGEANTVCGSQLVREFVVSPSAIDHLGASCARTVPAIRAVGSFPTGLAQITPLRVSAGTELSRADLQLGAAAISTAGDAIARYDAIAYASDSGLRGGSVVASESGATLLLNSDQLVPGVRVSGTIRLREASNPLNGQIAKATLTVTARGLRAARITAAWATAGANTVATVLETIDQDRVKGTMPAP